MEFSFKLKVNATKKKIWEYYSNIEKWYTWEMDLKNITLNGNFETGSVGTMELEGMPPIEYLLTSVTPNTEFWDMSSTPFGDIYFGHEILEEHDGIYIKHTVQLKSNEIAPEKIEFLKQIFSDVPDSILLLKKEVEK